MMKTVAVCLLIVGVACAHLMSFEEWAMKHNKVYASHTVSQRRAIFNENMKMIAKLNQHSDNYGANEFMDLTAEEFAATHLSPVAVDYTRLREEAARSPAFINTNSIPRVNDLPTNFNWVEQGAVTPIKNQEQCGSCFSFSAIGNMEGQWKLHGPTQQLLSFSEQLIVDCDRECMQYMNQSVCDAGCKGGLMPNVFSYSVAHGAALETEYPYHGAVSQCAYHPEKAVANFTKWTMVEEDEEAIRSYLYTNGPLSIAVDATYWQFYLHNIYKGLCSTTKMDHGVLLVGWGVEKNEPYWIIKNSWGTSWGKDGYIWLLRGKNKCGVKNFACSILI